MLALDELIQLLEDPELNISYNGSYYFFTYYNEKNRKHNITSHNKTSHLIDLLNTVANGKLHVYQEHITIDAEKSLSDAYSLSGIHVTTDLIKLIDTVTKPKFGYLIMYGAKVHFARFPEDREKLIKNFSAKINPPATSHFTPAIFPTQIHQKPDMSGVLSDINFSETDKTPKLKKVETVDKSKPVIDHDKDRKDSKSSGTYSTYYNSGYPTDTLATSKAPFICVLDSEGPHTLANCLKEENALETKYE